MKIGKNLIIFVMFTLLLVGCASTGLKKSDYHNRLGRIELGMTKSYFKQIFPESIPRSAKQYTKGAVEGVEGTEEDY